MVNILVISILIIPWLILPFNHIPDCTRLIKAAFFDYTMIGIIIMAPNSGLKFEYKNKYLAYLSAWVFFTYIFNWYFPIMIGSRYNLGAIDSMIHFILAVVATILVCSNFQKIDFIRLAKAMCISGTLISVFCIFQAIGLDPMKNVAQYGFKDERHIAALLDHPDIVGNYLCMVLPFFLYFRKTKYYICLGLCLLAMLFTKSSLSIAAAFIGTFFYLLFRFSKVKTVVIGLLISQLLFIFFCIVNPSFSKVYNGFTGRIEAWKMMLDKDNNPLFGQGLGIVKNLGVVTNQSVNKESANHWMYAHNDYLEIYISLGFLGLFLLALNIIHLFKNFNYKEDNQIGFAYYGAFISFLIIMFGSFPMEMPPLALNGLICFWALQKT